MRFSLLRALGLNITKKTGVKSQGEGQYKKLPTKLEDLGPSYGALIRELGKR